MSVQLLPSLKTAIGTQAVRDTEGQELVVLRDLENLTEFQFAVPLPLASFLVEVLDGRHTREAAAVTWATRTGGDVPVTKFDDIVTELDRVGLLATARRDRLLVEQRDAYHAPGVRRAVAATTCYPSDPAAFQALLDGAVEPASTPPSRCAAVLMPHVDPRGAAVAYGAAARALATSPAEVFLVLGTSHDWMSRPFALTTLDYETPWGRLPTDRALVERLAQRGGGHLLDAEVAHARESTVEFPAVWLHAACRDRPDLRIVPILVGSVESALRGGDSPLDDAAFVDFAAALREILGEGGERCALVAGVDFAHVGPQYDGDAALTREAIGDVLALDRRLLAHAEAVDAGAFFRTIQEGGNATQVCSTAPITLFLAALDGLGLRGRVLAHDAYEIVPGSFVSYATAAYARVR